ncbi:MAG TPA: nuclear transport factor 2 family protein [Woeseiaceae bacterium]|nr:nuclear transport factor 2 family protein [Woeseiaceae bacterium]
MSASNLLEILKSRETELHQLETRRNKTRLEELLHPSFREFGRSGHVLSRDEVLEEFSDITEYPSVVAMNFEIRAFGEDAALLTYTSAHVGQSGDLHRYTLRSSLWVRGPDGWRMCFHQGTPTGGPSQGAA